MGQYGVKVALLRCLIRLIIIIILVGGPDTQGTTTEPSEPSESPTTGNFYKISRTFGCFLSYYDKCEHVTYLHELQVK